MHAVFIGTRFRLASSETYNPSLGMSSMTTSSPSPLPRSSPAYRAIGWAGLLAGTLDITAAIAESGLEGKGPLHMFQGIAGGLLGMSSFQGGLPTAALGAFFHYLIATTAAAVFYLVSRKWKGLVRHPIPSGLLYGVAVYIFMYYIVLPLSAYHSRIALPRMSHLIRDVAVHMFMVGLPIALMVRKYADTASFPDGKHECLSAEEAST